MCRGNRWFSMRACAMLALVLILSVVFTGIPAVAQKKPAVVRLWDYHIHDKKFRKQAFNEFNKANPDINVEYTSQVSGTYTTILDAAFRSGSPPDIFVPTGGAPISKLVEMGWVMPLDDIAPSKEELRNWMAGFPQEQTPFLEEINVFGGKVYSWPTGAQGGRYMLFWNKQLFREGGLVEPPETLDDVRLAARKITELGQKKIYGIVHGIKEPTIWEQDVFFPAAYMGWPMIGWPVGLDLRTGRYNYHHPGIKKNIQIWFDMKQDGSIFPGDLSMDDEQAKFKFTQELAGMQFGGSWNPGGYLAINPSLDFDTSLPPTDTRGGVKGSLAIGGGGLSGASEYIVSSRTENRDAIWRVIKFMTSQQYQEGWVKAGGGFSVFPEYNKPEYFPHPTIAKIAQMGVTGRRTIPQGPPQKVWNTIIELMDPVRPNHFEIMQGMWIGQLGWEAWDDLERRLNDSFDKALAEARKKGINVTQADFTFPDWDPAQNYPPPKGKK